MTTYGSEDWVAKAELAGLRRNFPSQVHGWGFINSGNLGFGNVYLRLSSYSSRSGEWPEGLKDDSLAILTPNQLRQAYMYKNLLPSAW